MEEEATSPTTESQRSGSLSSKLFSGLLSRNKEVPKKEQVAGEILYFVYCTFRYNLIEGLNSERVLHSVAQSELFQMVS